MRLLKILLVVGLVASLSACDLFERRDRTFDDDPKLEFFPLSQSISESTLDDEGLGSFTLAPEVQLIGRQRDSDLNFAISIADSSTAVEGEHFTLSSTQGTIPSGESETEIPVEVLNNDQDDGGTVHVLFLNIKDVGGGAQPAENLRTYTLQLEGADE